MDYYVTIRGGYLGSRVPVASVRAALDLIEQRTALTRCDLIGCVCGGRFVEGEYRDFTEPVEACLTTDLVSGARLLLWVKGTEGSRGIGDDGSKAVASVDTV
tara:strand:+ start:8431 stop:8736 length:306 start_codon:yes stop_codon:yes gene_type:complete